MTIFDKAINWLKKIFQTLLFQVEETVFPFIIDFLNNVKKVIDFTQMDLWIEFIPASIEKEKFIKIKDAISVALANYNKRELKIDTAANPVELNEKLTQLFLDVKLNNKQERGEFFSTVGAKLLQALSENEISFATAVMQLEYFYRKVYKQEEE